MEPKAQGFFGYSSTPTSSGEAIEKAVVELNNTHPVNIITWKNLAKGGSLVINDILNTIDKSDFTCYDLTEMNDNVLFEIGYSLAKKKPMWLIFDTSIEESYRKWEQLGLLRDITYASYSNHNNIVHKFGQDKPYEGSEIFSRLLEDFIDTDASRNVLLYLKQQTDTTASASIDLAIKTRQLPVVVDDPAESKVQNLSWYIQNVYSSVAVLGELSSTKRNGSALQNMKCSFVCGLAKGLKKRMFMLAEWPYKAPSDYRSLVREYDTFSKVEKPFLNDFLNETKSDAVKLFASPIVRNAAARKRSDLQSISFGEWIAEHEKFKISDYYVELKHMKTLVKNEHNIIVGRKGCGKSASFFYLNDILSGDVRNIVCAIKPNSFDIDSLLALLRLAQEDYQKHYLIETSWKFLIYTELARTIYDRMIDKQLHAISEIERKFISYIDANKSIFLSDFSTRLETKLVALTQHFSELTTQSQEIFKGKIAEQLHNTVLYEIRSFIADLAPKSGKIIVLIDNLDKSWHVNNNLRLLSEWIFGLLSVSGRIAKEISVIKHKKVEIEFNLTIFLRSDILKHVTQFAREPDKIEKTELTYDDREMLFRIMNERFITLNTAFPDADEFWERYIASDVHGQSVKEFIYTKILPRPRDLLYFIRHAKDTAVARGHSIIESNDLIKAHDLYSEWVLTSLFVENGITQQQMEGFLYNLAGNNQIITEDDISVAIQLASIEIKSSEYLDYFIDHLVALSIIGREVNANHFVYEYDLNVDKRNKIQAAKLATKRYRVHNALVPALRLESC